MSYREHIPHPALLPFVDRFWTRRAGGPPETVRVLPDGCVDIIVNLGTGRGLVVGTMTRPLVLAGVTPRNTVAVRFRPGGAVPFLAAPAHALTDLDFGCAELGLTWLDAPRLCEARDPVRAARLLEGMLLRRLPVVRPPDPLVAHAVRALFGPAPPRIEALASRLGWSRQHLGRVFRVEVGLGPKELERVARVQRAVAAIQGHPGLAPVPGPGPRSQGLAAVAAALGFFDEAHMDREFRALVGVTPGVVKTSAGSIRPIPSLLAVA